MIKKGNSTKSYIPYGRHQVTEEDISSVDILKSNNLTQGAGVPIFEEEVNNLSIQRIQWQLIAQQVLFILLASHWV